MVVDLEPGIHEFSVKVETTDHLRMELEPDETYFVQCVMTFGILRARPDLRPSTSEEFKTFKKIRINDD